MDPYITAILIRREGDTQGECHVMTQTRDGNEISTSQRMLRTVGNLQKLEEARKDSPSNILGTMALLHNWLQNFDLVNFLTSFF